MWGKFHTNGVSQGNYFLPEVINELLRALEQALGCANFHATSQLKGKRKESTMSKKRERGAPKAKDSSLKNYKFLLSLQSGQEVTKHSSTHQILFVRQLLRADLPLWPPVKMPHLVSWLAWAQLN